MIKKYILNFSLIIFIILLIYVIVKSEYSNVYTENNEPSEKVKIVASFYPLAEFAKQIGGENVNVEMITPNGIEPHDFEPTPKDILKIQSSDIFIFNGMGFDSWAEKVAKDGVRTINVTEFLNAQYKKKILDNKIDDPHIWLDPVLVKEIVSIILEELKQIGPERSATYDYNAEIYTQKLSEIDEAYKKRLVNCEIRDAVASHNAFHYIEDRYNINITSISGTSPEQEPSILELIEIAKLIKEKNIMYVFSEPLVAPKLAETIAKETGSKLLVLNPIESLTVEDSDNNKDYVSIMYDNLNNLRTALRCL